MTEGSSWAFSAPRAFHLKISTKKVFLASSKPRYTSEGFPVTRPWRLRVGQCRASCFRNAASCPVLMRYVQITTSGFLLPERLLAISRVPFACCCYFLDVHTLLSGIDLDVYPHPLSLETIQAGRVVDGPASVVRFLDQNKRSRFPLRRANCRAPAIALANAIGLARFTIFRAATLVAHPSDPGFGLRTDEQREAETPYT